MKFRMLLFLIVPIIVLALITAACFFFVPWPSGPLLGLVALFYLGTRMITSLHPNLQEYQPTEKYPVLALMLGALGWMACAIFKTHALPVMTDYALTFVTSSFLVTIMDTGVSLLILQQHFVQNTKKEKKEK